MDDHVEVLVTVVLVATDDRAARSACRELVWQVDGRIVETTDCSAEEPGCWSVTVRVPSEERATHTVAAPLARAVRQFVRGLGDDFPMPRVACEPPTAWTVLDDPDAVEDLVPGAERLLVEAWCGGDPYPQETDDPDDEDGEQTTGDPAPAEGADETPDDALDEDEALDDPDEPTPPPAPPTPPQQAPPPPAEPAVAEEPRWPTEHVAEPAPRAKTVAAQPREQRRHPRGQQAGDGACRLTLRVDVATTRPAGAEWQARALASRISRTATLSGVTAHDGVLSVVVDLGTAHTPAPQTVLTAVSALDRAGWSALRWEGETAITTWTARPRPTAGITELELSSRPEGRRRRS